MKCRQIFESYLRTVGKTSNTKLEFKESNTKKKSKTAAVVDSDAGDDLPLKQNGDVPKPKRTRKPPAKPVQSDNENDLPDDDIPEKKTATKKRKSLEPALVGKVKKTKLTPKATPPTKKNYMNTGTQTSEPRDTRSKVTKQVTFVTPNRTPKQSNGVDSVNSSGDIFDDSFEIQKVKPKRKLLAEREVTQTRVVKKKVTTAKKGKSWKDAPAVVNGRSPPQ